MSNNNMELIFGIFIILFVISIGIISIEFMIFYPLLSLGLISIILTSLWLILNYMDKSNGK